MQIFEQKYKFFIFGTKMSYLLFLGGNFWNYWKIFENILKSFELLS